MDPQVPESEPTLPVRPRRRRGVVREVIDTLLLAAVLYAAVRALVVPYGVDGASMDPNLHDGERLFVNRNAYFHYDANWFRNLLPGDDRAGADIVYPFDGPERGDIVVFDPPVPDPDKPYIKRVIGLPGETVTFRDGRVYVDGRVLNEEYIDGAITDCPRTEECVLGPIPEDHVVVLGDNRGHSRDSRDFGFVATDRIIGKAVFANWPVEDFGRLSQPDYGDD